MTGDKRTTVTMLLAGPDGAVYGVYRAHVRNRTQRWSWNLVSCNCSYTVGQDERCDGSCTHSMAKRALASITWTNQ